MVDQPLPKDLRFPERDWAINAIKVFLETNRSSGNKMTDATALYEHLYGNWAMVQAYQDDHKRRQR